MSVYRQGTTATFVADFFDVPGGTAVDVTGLTVTITNLSMGVVLGPTSSGIVHAGLGVYSYPWAIPSGQVVGDYLISWDSNEADASETFSIITTAASGIPTAGPCQTWEPVWCGELPISLAAVTGDALVAATEVLWAKSGRQFGFCDITLRPCRRDCFGGSSSLWNEFGTGWPYPYNWNGQWFNLGCGGCVGECSCTVLQKVQLPTPIADVLEIFVDGALLEPTAYKVYDNQMLIRTDGGMWPICNDLNKDDTEIDTWSIRILTGTAVPMMGRRAVGELAEQFARACVDDGDCMLPQPVQQLVRQGVSMTFLDPNEVFAAGRLGLYQSDLFLSTFNPAGIAQRAVAVDVDSRGPRRQTWP